MPLNDEAPATKAAEDPPPSYSELFPDYAAVPQQSTDLNWRSIKTIASISSSKLKTGRELIGSRIALSWQQDTLFSNCQLPFKSLPTSHLYFSSLYFNLQRCSSTIFQAIIPVFVEVLLENVEPCLNFYGKPEKFNERKFFAHEFGCYPILSLISCSSRLVKKKKLKPFFPRASLVGLAFCPRKRFAWLHILQVWIWLDAEV